MIIIDSLTFSICSSEDTADCQGNKLLFLGGRRNRFAGGLNMGQETTMIMGDFSAKLSVFIAYTGSIQFWWQSYLSI